MYCLSYERIATMGIPMLLTRFREWLMARYTLALHQALYGRRQSGSQATPFLRAWRTGRKQVPLGAVHVSMNDYLIHRPLDVPRVALAGLRFWKAWPSTEGALGLWFAGARGGRRSISVSVWRAPEDLRHFVRSPAHVKVMRDFRGRGALYTNAWAAEQFDRSLIWRQAEDRLRGRIQGVPHN